MLLKYEKLQKYLDEGYLLQDEADTLEDLLKISNDNIDIEENKLENIEDLCSSYIILEENSKFYRLG